MMNRRKFFQSMLGSAVAASVAPAIFLPKIEPVRWKVNPRLVPNPEWVNAEAEIYVWPGINFSEVHEVPLRRYVMVGQGNQSRWVASQDGILIPAKQVKRFTVGIAIDERWNTGRKWSSEA